jgi:hypothetical protein
MYTSFHEVSVSEVFDLREPSARSQPTGVPVDHSSRLRSRLEALQVPVRRERQSTKEHQVSLGPSHGSSHDISFHP